MMRMFLIVFCSFRNTLKVLSTIPFCKALTYFSYFSVKIDCGIRKSGSWFGKMSTWNLI